MQYKGFLVPRRRYISRILQGDITRDAEKRLTWMDFLERTGNARLTCRHFGISPDTLYCWRRRYKPKNLKSLEAHPSTKRPRHIRVPQIQSDVVSLVRSLREQYPRWGKEKIARLVWKEGYDISVSTVGRTITRLKQQGLLKEPIPNFISAKKRFLKRAWGIRKPETFKAHIPGDLVEVDTMDIRPVPGTVRKQFTARDIVSRWDTLHVFGNATALLAAKFLDLLVRSSPFHIRAIQIDGGSEFKGAFEEACRQQGIILYVLPPRSPKLNGCVERSNRTHTEEFYEVNDFSFDIKVLNEELHVWQTIYNTVRPNQAIGYLTPLEYIMQWKQQGGCVRDVLN
jgi:transposase InsO family protein